MSVRRFQIFSDYFQFYVCDETYVTDTAALWSADSDPMLAVGQVLGGWLGSHAAMRFGPKLIRPLLVTICVGMVIKLLSDPTNPLRAWMGGLI